MGWLKHFLGRPNPEYWGVAGAGVLAMARDTGRFLVQLRSPLVMEPGTWNVVGGALEIEDYDGSVEDPEGGAYREFFEETGYDGLLQLEPLWLYYDPEQDFEYHTFLGVMPHEFRPHQTWESSGWAWLDFNELVNLEPKHYGLAELLSHPEVLMALHQSASW
jgi:8-oxo-dGTP pyrophosphatase MutT (NUDIX family)